MNTDCPYRDCQASKSVDEDDFCNACARIVPQETVSLRAEPMGRSDTRKVGLMAPSLSSRRDG